MATIPPIPEPDMDGIQKALDLKDDKHRRQLLINELMAVLGRAEDRHHRIMMGPYECQVKLDACHLLIDLYTDSLEQAGRLGMAGVRQQLLARRIETVANEAEGYEALVANEKACRVCGSTDEVLCPSCTRECSTCCSCSEVEE